MTFILAVAITVGVVGALAVTVASLMPIETAAPKKTPKKANPKKKPKCEVCG